MSGQVVDTSAHPAELQDQPDHEKQVEPPPPAELPGTEDVVAPPDGDPGTHDEAPDEEAEKEPLHVDPGTHDEAEDEEADTEPPDQHSQSSAAVDEA